MPNRTSTTLIFRLAMTLHCVGEGAYAQQPNLIFILADDLGYGDLGVTWQNGRKEPRIRTPHLDQMAKEGTLLARHYAPAPVCAPARGSLLTGMTQGHANIRDNQFDKGLENNHNIANALRSRGYYTAMVGKYGLQGQGETPAQWPAYPTKRGFDYYYGYVRHADGHQHYPAHTWALGSGDARGPKQVWENDSEVSAGLDKCYTGDLFTAKAKQILKTRVTGKTGQPFFLFLAYDTPHAALQLPAMAYPQGKGADSGVQWLGTPGRMINTAGGAVDSYRDPLYGGLTLDDAHERLATILTRLDHQVGDLLKTVKDLGIAGNTVVVFSSDNGPSDESYLDGGPITPQLFQSFGPFEGFKRDVFEGGVREPTLAWGPGRITANRTSQRVSQLHDWMATILDFAGSDRPARIDGVSLRPELTGVGTQRQGITYVEYSVNGAMPKWQEFSNHGGTLRNQAQSIYLDGYKGIRNNVASHAQDFAIYEVDTDKRESRNLAGTSPFFTQLQQRMKDRVLQVRMPDASAPRAYDAVAVPAVPDSSVAKGVEVRSFEGTWDWVPDFSNMKAKEVRVEPQIDLSRLSRTADAGLFFTGYLSVPAPGEWTFYARCDKGIVFKLHDKLVLDGDYGYQGGELSRTVNLAAGLHPFRICYRTAGGAPDLQFQWSGPGTAKSPIAPSRLFTGSIVSGIKPAGTAHVGPGGRATGRTVDGRYRRGERPGRSNVVK